MNVNGYAHKLVNLENAVVCVLENYFKIRKPDGDKPPFTIK